jgi:hypothetical protein
VRRWRAACRGLARAFDEVMRRAAGGLDRHLAVVRRATR